MEGAKGNLFLVGPMGVGKTTIGRYLARILDLEFIDSDHVIEERTGADIPWIFDIEGEAGFRRRERAAIEELTRRRGIVLATGGGVVLDPKNREDLTRNGTVVFLQASIDKILDRTSKTQHRPLLQTDEPRTRIEQLIHEREPLYREIANITVDTDRRGIRSAVNFIIKQLPEYRAVQASGAAGTPQKKRKAKGAHP